jgi:hypothetical protein
MASLHCPTATALRQVEQDSQQHSPLSSLAFPLGYKVLHLAPGTSAASGKAQKIRLLGAMRGDLTLQRHAHGFRHGRRQYG